MNLALQLYYDKNGAMPPNPTPCCGAVATTALAPLVAQGFIAAIPTSPNPYQPYSYYDYGAGNSVGALIVSAFVITAPSIGYGGSCRPWPATTNWCDLSVNNFYCICNPY